jgi:hypothetical protein
MILNLKAFIMNIRHTIYLLAIVGLTACSGNDDVQNDSLEAGKLARELVASDVPITFAPVELADVQWGAEPMGETRGGSVNGDDFTMDSLGIFCLAKKKLADGPVNPLWDGLTSKFYKPYHLYADNVMASVIGTEEGKGIIQWDKEFKMHYYPANAWYTYGFVAYHPWTDCIVRAKKLITAYFKVDGNDDLIYAICPGPERTFGDDAVDTLGFSKQYYDAIRTQGLDWEGTYPKLQFQRLMSRLDFYFKLDYTPTKNLHIDKVEFNNFRCIMAVPLASLDNTNGVMSNTIPSEPYVLNQSKLKTIKVNGDTIWKTYPEMASYTGRFELREKGETPISGIKAGSDYRYNLSSDPIKVGDCILIPPVLKKWSNSSISLYVTLCDDDDKKFRNKTAITIPAPDPRWDMGTRYKVEITLNAPPGYNSSSAPALRTAPATTTDADGVTLWQPDATVSVTARK